MQVRSERGDVLARASCGLPWFEMLASVDRAEFPMLGGLDPYGDAIFNGRQVPMLMEELERLPDERRAEWVEEVHALCVTVLKAPHRYLWFIGD
ncbi:hypothetical protein [Streptomyces sp. NPDC001307]|uniref:hypothetical protein n=1 Tax=Streptomyces sp. NPDC001307 TaxID=3364560 RepID=UPI0036B3B6FF